MDTTELTAVTTGGGALEMTFDSFYGRVLELTGNLAGEQELFAAAGTYRSSDERNGSWTIDQPGRPNIAVGRHAGGV